MDKKLFTVIPYKKKLLYFSRPSKAFLYYKNKVINLLTGEVKVVAIEHWIETLGFEVIKHNEKNRFIHFMYECGFLFEDLKDLIPEDAPLAIDVSYLEVGDYVPASKPKAVKLKSLKFPHYNEYEKKFHSGYNELLQGNCYQFNLTEDFLYEMEDSLQAHDIISKIWENNIQRGAYGSATYVEHLDNLFLSNSPECLFQYEKGKLITRPVKGTLKRKSSKISELNALWNQLIKDEKSQAELFMITDLLRNDLSRIDLPKAMVTKMKAPLLVPGIIHQYSEIMVELRSHVTFKDVICKLYPGGSITGAPKKNVMGLLKKLENRNRGFYCGSTVMLNSKSIVASINIRSSVIDFKTRTLSYQAGGGITLKSTAQNEYDELYLKHESFLTLLTL